MSRSVCRFAPTTSGPAHPGTLLAALLCWLDARTVGAHLILRLEDLDTERCRPEWSHAMREDLEWLGVEFDEVCAQSERSRIHEAALDALGEAGLLYPCACTRAVIRAAGARTPDGGFRYPNTCRDRALPPGGWRRCEEPLRVRLPGGIVSLVDEGGTDLTQDPGALFGDPLVRRRDGAVSYQLATVVDDAQQGVTRIVRGRDLAASTATQCLLGRLLGHTATPAYRHHFLLREEIGGKLAKLHGAVSAAELRRHYSAQALCGLLAHAAGLQATDAPTTPTALREVFSWDRVGARDRVLRWSPPRLHLLGPA